MAYLGHLLIENCRGLIVDAMASIAEGFAEREAATLMMVKQWEAAPGRRRTLGADTGYDAFDFVELMRELEVTPHVTQNLKRRAAARLTAARRDTTATVFDDAIVTMVIVTGAVFTGGVVLLWTYRRR